MRRNDRLHIGVVVIAVAELIAATVTVAQPNEPSPSPAPLVEQRSPEFPRDFARSPLGTENVTDSTVVAAPPEESQPALNGEGSEDDSSSVMDEGEGVPILALSLLVNGEEKEHFEQVLSEYDEITNTYSSVKPKTSYVLGGLGFLIGSPKTASIALKGGKLYFRDTLPQRYKNLKTSPTWILTSASGHYILEGVGPLAPLFNNRGNFVPARLERRISSEPRPTPSTGSSVLLPPNSIRQGAPTDPLISSNESDD